MALYWPPHGDQASRGTVLPTAFDSLCLIRFFKMACRWITRCVLFVGRVGGRVCAKTSEQDGWGS